jgi:hypothetical protein
MYLKEYFIFKGFLYDGNNLTMWAELDILLAREN